MSVFKNIRDDESAVKFFKIAQNAAEVENIESINLLSVNNLKITDLIELIDKMYEKKLFGAIKSIISKKNTFIHL